MIWKKITPDIFGGVEAEILVLNINVYYSSE